MNWFRHRRSPVVDPTLPGPPIDGGTLRRANYLNWGNCVLRPGERAIGVDEATRDLYMRYDDRFPPRLERVVYDRDAGIWRSAETGEHRPRMEDGTE